MNEMVVRSYRARREIVAQIAPRYREASLARKRVMLDSLVEMTGYARKYAIALLHQETPPGPPTIRRPRPSRYGSEVQQALFVAWKATSSICAKRLISFLPKLLPYLERKGRLQLNEEQRTQLLTMSSATAERLLRTQHKPVLRDLSTTKAGTLLKSPFAPLPGGRIHGLLAAVASLFTSTIRQRCVVHKQRNVLNALPHRERKEVSAELAAIFKQEKKEDALLNLSAFKAKYQKRYPEAIRSLSEDEEHFTLFRRSCIGIFAVPMRLKVSLAMFGSVQIRLMPLPQKPVA